MQKTPDLFQGEFEFARAGDKVARDARKAVEAQTGVLIITSKTTAQLNQVVANLIESGIPTAEDPKEKNNFSTTLKKRDLEWHLKCSHIPKLMGFHS